MLPRVVDALVALDLGAAEEQPRLLEQQSCVVEGVVAGPGQGLAVEVARTGRKALVAGFDRLEDERLPAMPGVDGDGAVIVSVVANVEVDPAVGRDQHGLAAYQDIAERDRGDGEEGAEGQRQSRTCLLSVRTSRPPEQRQHEDERQDRRPRDRRQPGADAGHEPGGARVRVQRASGTGQDAEVEQHFHRDSQQLAVEVDGGAVQGEGRGGRGRRPQRHHRPRQAEQEHTGESGEQRLKGPGADEEGVCGQ